MSEDGPEIECVRGQMGLTKMLATALYESFIERSVGPKQPIPIGYRIGGMWFCPGCGVPMREVTGTNGMVCPECKGNLGPFIYELVEFHPHRFGDRWG